MHTNRKRTLASGALFALLAVCGAPLLSAAESGTGTSLTATGALFAAFEDRRAAIVHTAIPRIRKKLLSLTLQGAPVPPELRELFDLAQGAADTAGIAAFEDAARRYFGEATPWEGAAVMHPGTEDLSPETALERTRTYLGAIALNAETLASFTNRSAEEIRAQAIALRERAGTVAMEEEWRAFTEAFGAFHAELFGGEQSVSDEEFRRDTRSLLRELSPVLPLLLGESTKPRSLRKTQDRIAGLDAGLDLLGDQEDLAMWTAHFDGVASAILRVSPPVPLSVLKQDLEGLLRNLEAELARLERMDLETEDIEERLRELRSALRNIATDADLDAFLRNLEELFEDMSSIGLVPATPSAPLSPAP